MVPCTCVWPPRSRFHEESRRHQHPDTVKVASISEFEVNVVPSRQPKERDDVAQHLAAGVPREGQRSGDVEVVEEG